MEAIHSVLLWSMCGYILYVMTEAFQGGYTFPYSIIMIIIVIFHQVATVPDVFVLVKNDTANHVTINFVRHLHKMCPL